MSEKCPRFVLTWRNEYQCTKQGFLRVLQHEGVESVGEVEEQLDEVFAQWEATLHLLSQHDRAVAQQEDGVALRVDERRTHHAGHLADRVTETFSVAKNWTVTSNIKSQSLFTNFVIFCQKKELSRNLECLNFKKKRRIFPFFKLFNF